MTGRGYPSMLVYKSGHDQNDEVRVVKKKIDWGLDVRTHMTRKVKGVT